MYCFFVFFNSGILYLLTMNIFLIVLSPHLLILPQAAQNKQLCLINIYISSAEYHPIQRPAGSDLGGTNECFSTSLKAGKSWWYLSSRKSRKRNFFYSGENESFLFYWHFDLISWVPLTVGRVIYFPKSTNFNINLILKHPPRHTQINICPNI